MSNTSLLGDYVKINSEGAAVVIEDSKSYLVPIATQVLVDFVDPAGVLDSAFVYEVFLTTIGTSTVSGAKYVIFYNGSWQLRLIGAGGHSSNHPLAILVSDKLHIYHNHSTFDYSIHVRVRKTYCYGTRNHQNIFGLEGHFYHDPVSDWLVNQNTVLSVQGLGTGANGVSFGLSQLASRFKIAYNYMPSSGHSHTLAWNSTTGIVSYYSSSRLVKSEIAPISYGLDAVLALQPRSYVNQDGEKKIGFIADEVEGVVPELVSLGEKKLFTEKEEDTETIPVSVHYQDMTAVLCKAIQEQQELIKTQAAQLEELKAKVTALESK